MPQTEPDIRVACVTDLDLVPPEAPYALSAPQEDDEGDETPNSKEQTKSPPTPAERAAALKCNDGGPLRTFVSPQWTLEYDLAATDLAPLVWEAVVVGAKQKSRAKNRKPPLSTAERQLAGAAAAKKLQSLAAAAAGSKAKLAASIYEPLYDKKASKAEVAELLAELLDGDIRTPEQLREAVPKYLVDAIDYVTRKPENPAP